MPTEPAQTMELTFKLNEIIPKINMDKPMTRLIIPVRNNQGYVFVRIKRTDTPKETIAKTSGNITGITEMK
jgi:hypothetical protein